MKEIAFIVNPNSEFYNQYFKAKEEKQRLHELAKKFFEKYDLVDGGKYYQTKFLGMQLNAEQKERFANQLRKRDDEYGMSRFKKNSPMQKSWSEEVASKIDFDVIDAVKFWYFGLISCGSYNLWDNKGTIYGYLKDNYINENISLRDDMKEIKMSEYYSVIESLED